MFNGKQKALTFSYDDGVTQDRRLVEIFNRYSLKATFNINSSLLGLHGSLERNGVKTTHEKILPSEVRTLYSGHEVAVHSLTHPDLTKLDDETAVYQIERDRIMLGELAGYDIVGMAYPNGTYNEHLIDLIKNNTGIHYSRTVNSTHNFELQNKYLEFNPTVYHLDIDKMFELGREFIDLKTDTPKLFYVWGHSYEFDAWDFWDKFEEFCKMMSGHDDIFYGTNSDVLH